MSDMHDDLVLELANFIGGGKKGPRRVATPEGAAFYGQPIGTIITADMIDAKRKENAAKGVKPSKGMLAKAGGAGNKNAGTPSGANPSGGGAQSSSGGQQGAQQGASQGGGNPGPVGGNVHKQTSFQAPGIDSTPPEWMSEPKPTPKLVTGVKPSSLAGPEKFKVGSASYEAPQGSRLIRPKSGAAMAIVIDPKGDIHFFTESGEVEADETVKKVMLARFGDKVDGKDTLYAEDEFEAEEGLDSVKVGETLKDASGNDVFTKTEDGWVHTALGLPVEDKDVLPAFESGELSTGKPASEDEVDDFDYGDDDDDVDIQFDAMESPEEFKAYVDSMEDGEELYAVYPNQTRVLTKKDGALINSLMGNEVEASALFYLKSNLTTIKPAEDKEESAPEEEPVKDSTPVEAPTEPMLSDVPETVADAPNTQKLDKAGTPVENKTAATVEPKSIVAEYLEGLNDYNSTQIKNQELGEFPKPEFYSFAPPGSQIFIPNTGDTYEKQPNGKWKNQDNFSIIPHSLKQSMDSKFVMKNTANGDTTWKPLNADSKDEVGDFPSLNFINEPVPGSTLQMSGGVKWHVNRKGFFVPDYAVNQVAGIVNLSGLRIAAIKGEVTISELNPDAKVLVGDKVGSDISKEDLYANAGPGTRVAFVESVLGAPKFYLTLDGNGLWNSSSSIKSDDYEINNPPNTPGSYYVSEFVQGDNNPKAGDKPTPAWLETSPVGSLMSMKDLTGKPNYWKKLESGEWTYWDYETGNWSDEEDYFEASDGFGSAIDSEVLDYKIIDSLPPELRSKKEVPSVNESSEVTVKKGAPATYEMVVEAPLGTKFKYNKLDGTQSDYVKMDDNYIFAPKGVILALEHWKDSIDKGKVEFAEDTIFKSTPMGETVINPEPTPETSIDLPEPVAPPTGDPDKDAKLYNDHVEALEEWESDLIELLPYVEEDEPAKSIEEVLTDLDAKNKTLDPGMPAASSQEIYEAIDALENHSHGSPIYGLKSLPKDHPANVSHKEIIDIAKGKFPGSAPKAAVLKYLKSFVDVAATEEEENDALEPVIHLGKNKVTKNAFGVTGGDFKKSDIEQAISIIEGYDGKQYKSQLTKADNPLYVLDFNTLVGPNKDKLAQKQQVIDLLKKEIAALPEPVASTDSPSGSLPTVPPEGMWLPIDDMSVELLPVNSKFKAYGQIEATFEVDIDGAGNTYYYSDEYPGDGESIYPDDLFGAEDAMGGPMFTAYEVWVDPLALETGNELAPVYFQDIDSLPVGTRLVRIRNGLKYTLVRVDSNTPYSVWEDEDSGIKLQGGNLASSAAAKSLYLLSYPENGVAPEPYVEPVNVESYEEFQNLPLGSVIGYGIVKYTKIAPNSWEKEGGSTVGPLPDDSFKLDADDGYLTLLSKPNNVPEQYTAPAAQASKIDEEGVGPADTTEHNFLPGLYTKTFNSEVFSIHVFADGSGNIASDKYSSPPMALTAYQLAVNYDLSSPDSEWTYQGVPGANLPKSSAASPQEKPAGKVKETFKNVNPKDLPDGLYYLGDPKNPDTITWQIIDGKVTQHNSDGSTSEVSQTKLKNAVYKGNLVNKFGNTKIVPDKHQGSVKFLNQPTTIPALLALRKALAEDGVSFKPDSEGQKVMAMFGVYADKNDLYDFVTIMQGGSYSEESTKKTLIDTIDAIAGPPETYPFADAEGEAISYFDWASGTGKAHMPDYAAKNFVDQYQYYDNAQAKAVIVEIGEKFGGGGIIGQHVTQMTAHQKRMWIDNFKAGNFKVMYDIEVAAATKKGVSHASGWKHPGYSGSELTNKIQWAPAVPGEIPAGEEVPGNWTPYANMYNMSMDEINNYLIAAKMQYPAWLTNSERSAWVIKHRLKQATAVDYYSVTAKLRAEAGEAPKGDVPTWKDGIEPPKNYTSLFNNDKYPTAGWTPSKAQEWVNDFNAGVVEVTGPDGKKKTYEDFYVFLEQSMADNPSYGLSAQQSNAVDAFFTSLTEEENELKSKPIYTMAPTQNVKKSLHPIYNVVDQNGKKYIFKPANEDVNGKQYRAEVEAEANKLAAFFGANAPKATVVTFNGQLGVMQEEIENVGSLNGFDYSSITAKQAGDLAGEHIIDWILDQDDNWAPNTLLLPNGGLAGVDKGRAFANYGSWDGMRPDSGMDVHTHLVYSDLYQAISKGQVPKEVADAAWLAAKKRADRIANADDGKVLEFLHAATGNRSQWKIDYKINGKKVPQTQQGFFDAFFDRKNKLPEQTRELWEKIYAKAGYGDLPEPVTPMLGDGQHSGLEDPAYQEAVMTVGSGGSSTLIGGADLKNGYALSWSVKNSDGTKKVHTYLQLAKQKQKQVLAWFKANTDPSQNNEVSADPTTFNYDNFGSKFVAAAKTVGHHAEDGNYNEGTLSNYDNAKADIEKDLNHWSPSLALDADGKATFPSGQEVFIGHLDQYKMMLEYYKNQQPIIDNAKAAKAKPEGTVVPYSPLVLPQAYEVYTNTNGGRLSKFSNGSWSYSKSDGTVTMLTPQEAEAIYSSPDWFKWSPASATPVAKQYKSKLLAHVHETEGTLNNFELTEKGTKYSSGMGGKEYEVVLDTGEKIYFRNESSTATNTPDQQGRISIVIPSASTPAEFAAGMENAKSWLTDNLNLNLDPVDEEGAELTYWRKMYDILADGRKHEAGSKWAKTYATLKKKIDDEGSTQANFLEDFGNSKSVTEQVQFFRDLWSEQFGDKVQSAIAEKKYLPNYEKLDMRYSDVSQGHPIWYRFDVDVKELEAAGHMIASKAYQTTHTLDVVKSGGAYSTEERMRVLGEWLGGISSHQDQSYGGSQSIFTRIYKDTKSSGISFIYHPRALLRTDSHSYPNDAFGNPDYNSGVWSNPLRGWIDNQTDVTGSSGPENDLKYHASLFGDLETVIFDNAQLLNEAIQYLKSLGIEQIRGLPIEDRLVMRNKLAATIAKLKKRWYA